VTPAVGDHTRRTFLLRTGIIVAGAAVAGSVGRVVGKGRRHVEEARRLLRLPGVTAPQVPEGVRVDLEGVSPWATPASDFYRIDTAFVVPTIEPDDWQLRIHGMVDREIVLTYRELIERQVTQAWVTLNCVSNEVGGDLIGNAWWSGVRVADLLREAGVQPGANAVLQTSEDGWTCGTPLEALTDGRDAMLAVAMNGKPLPLDHGFPVRTIVPGLYGYVSACKWVVEMKVTRFDDIEAYWTKRGWAELGPVKIASRIDVPGDGGDVLASGGRVGGVAWAQHDGISAVEVSVDDGPWERAELGRVPSTDTWVQWAATVDVEPGEHTLAVRATDTHGQPQTGEVQDTVPDGATGWHTITFEAKESLDG
jgi:DMSO/TMAO reductase YedYZ molybdopterin-dependent catalytic subunit